MREGMEQVRHCHVDDAGCQAHTCHNARVKQSICNLHKNRYREHQL